MLDIKIEFAELWMNRTNGKKRISFSLYLDSNWLNDWMGFQYEF